jgi:hypothetical protein
MFPWIFFGNLKKIDKYVGLIYQSNISARKIRFPLAQPENGSGGRHKVCSIQAGLFEV